MAILFIRCMVCQTPLYFIYSSNIQLMTVVIRSVPRVKDNCGICFEEVKLEDAAPLNCVYHSDCIKKMITSVPLEREGTNVQRAEAITGP